MTELRFPTVWNPQTHLIYKDDPYSKEPTYDTPLMDTRAFVSQLGGESKAASTVSLEHIFYEGLLDDANQYFDKVVEARRAPTHKERMSKAASLMDDNVFENLKNTMIIAQSLETKAISKAGAIITSKDYTDFQTQTFVGEQLQPAIRTGILASLFQTVALPQLTGKWLSSFTNDLKYYRNIPESKSPEPSKGVGAVTTVSIQKHGGAVAITQRAQAVINSDNPFQRLVTAMGQKRLFDENDMIADEIEGNTAHTLAGVDFGLRAGTPPASSTNPVDFLTSLRTTFEALSQDVNLFISKGFMYSEYSFNDIIRGGVNNPPPTLGGLNEQVGPFPGLNGVTWARDDAITSTTAGWAMNSDAIKLFRGPSRNYTIADEDTESTKYVTKNYFLPDTMDTALVYEITGIAAP